MVDQSLTECAAFVGVFHRFFVAYSRVSEGLDDDSDSLVVEVGHDD